MFSSLSSNKIVGLFEDQLNLNLKPETKQKLRQKIEDMENAERKTIGSIVEKYIEPFKQKNKEEYDLFMKLFSFDKKQLQDFGHDLIMKQIHQGQGPVGSGQHSEKEQNSNSSASTSPESQKNEKEQNSNSSGSTSPESQKIEKLEDKLEFDFSALSGLSFSLSNLQKIEDTSDANVFFYLASCFCKGTETCQKNPEYAFKFALKAAEIGHAEAQSLVGCFYYAGFGIKQDVKEAVKWFEKSCDQNCPSGMNNLGYFYLHGFGVTKHDKFALYLFKMAAQNNCIQSNVNIGYCYEYGCGLEEKDYNIAFSYYNKAAEKNSTQGNYRLALCYENGIGCNINLYAAFHCYEKAGYQFLRPKILELNKKLGLEDDQQISERTKQKRLILNNGK